MQKLAIKYRSVDSLIPYARNARTHSEEQVSRIAASIKEFGWTNPILIDGENGIIAGHGRVMAARKLGIIEVPTIELSDLTDTQKRAYILADNKLALDAGWDEELLSLELADLKDLDFDLGLTGFSTDELDELLADAEEHPTEDPEAEQPDPPENPVTKQGDVWILGVHRLYCGDSCKPESIGKVLGSDGGGVQK